jgi:hypothetical protein
MNSILKPVEVLRVAANQANVEDQTTLLHAAQHIIASRLGDKGRKLTLARFLTERPK